MDICITSIQELRKDGGQLIRTSIVEALFPKNVGFDAFKTVYRKLGSLFDAMRDDLCVVIETEYVDKDYRDAYYRYFATKHREYKRNCVRLSFFECEVRVALENITDNQKDEEYFQSKYQGFVVLRPLYQCLGRNVISPNAMKNSVDLAMTGVSVKSSCMGLKLNVWGFPHASQDGQMMTCAETTVWSMSEYFGEKYSLYSRVFPHNIIDLLYDASFQRQIPSEGLTYSMISRALLKEGLDCRVYHKDNPMFKELLSCYVESSFPIALAIEGKGFGHAVVCMGRKNVSRDIILNCKPSTIYRHKAYVWNRCVDEFVSNDDNQPPYSIFDFSTPTSHYKEKGWNDTKISCMIVPLHPKIYVEAEKAIELSNSIVLQDNSIDVPVIKTFLTTSRSYKEFVLFNTGIKPKVKEVLLQMDTPKFLWVTEISTKDDFLAGKVNRMILLDSTANSDCGMDAMISYFAFEDAVPAFENLKIK